MPSTFLVLLSSSHHMKNLLDFFRKNTEKEIIEKGIREPLKRSEPFMTRYEIWKASNSLDVLLFLQNTVQTENDALPWLTRLRSPQAHGLAFHSDADLPDFEWMFVMELIRERLAQQGYILQRSLREEKMKGESVFEIQSYYLKPRPDVSEVPGKHIQRFGNILLEYTEINREFEKFSIQANYYSGFQYQPSEPLTGIFIL